MHKLDGHMLSVGRQSAVAESQQPPTLVEAARHSPARLSNLFRLCHEERFRDAHTLLEARGNQRFQFRQIHLSRHQYVSLWQLPSLRRAARHFSSFNLARVQHFEFIGISLTHKLKRIHCLPRLSLVDLAHGKAHVNQYPISRADSLWPHQRHTDIAFHARDIYFGNGICVVHDVYDLTWYTKTHMILLYRTVVDAMNRAL